MRPAKLIRPREFRDLSPDTRTDSRSVDERRLGCRTSDPEHSQSREEETHDSVTSSVNDWASVAHRSRNLRARIQGSERSAARARHDLRFLASELRKSQPESLTQRRDTVEVDIKRVTLVEPREFRHVAASLSEIAKVLLEPCW